MIIWHKRIVYWIAEGTNTNSDNVKLTAFFTATMVTARRFCVIRTVPVFFKLNLKPYYQKAIF
jgi:hypothetical protein